MNTIMLEPVAVRARGRFRAIVHTGHKFDQFGNIVEHGRVLRETPFNNNKITLTGFSNILQNLGGSMTMVAGAGNTTPTEGDGTLVSYLGKSATAASVVTTRNTVPDGNNEVWWRTTYRVTFGPSSMGGGTVNVAEAGIVLNVGFGSVVASTPVSARGLLVDGGGLPTTVSVNNAIEYLDIIWEYTEWLKASVTGTVTLSIDGVDTVHDYEVRPYNFANTGGSYNYGGWQNIGSMTLAGYAPNASKSGYPRTYATWAWAGPLIDITDASVGAVTADIPTSFGSSAYVTNSKQRTMTLTWLPLEANIAGGIGAVRVNLGHSNWQVSFNPKIAKINTKQLNLMFTYAMANR